MNDVAFVPPSAIATADERPETVPPVKLASTTALLAEVKVTVFPVGSVVTSFTK